MTPALTAIVEESYRVFGGYALGPALTVCRCPVCMAPKTERELITTPLSQLQSPLLAEYTNSAHGWDDDCVATEMRYFLPRYLELIALNNAPDHLGLPACLRRLAEADWRSKWPAQEIDLLDRFFAELVVSSLPKLDLLKWPVGWRLKFDLVDVLALIVTAHGNVDAALAAWDAADDPAAAIHMAALRDRLTSNDGAMRLYSAFLEGDHKVEAGRIGAFLVRPAVHERIEAAFFSVEDPRLQKILSDALIFN